MSAALPRGNDDADAEIGPRPDAEQLADGDAVRAARLEAELEVEADVVRRGVAGDEEDGDDDEEEDDDEDDDDDDDDDEDEDADGDADDEEASAWARTQASLYYDAATMASLNPVSIAAISRLRAYRPPPFPLWDALPTRRRAAVLVLLYADRHGDLRVVVTMRAASLRSFSGHAALPGGKADNENETPFQIARREAFEEIGLPVDDARLPRPFRIEPLCVLPPSLARTHLVVTPCVAFLHADRSLVDAGAAADESALLVEESMMPRLDAREVAALFSAPLYNFLKAEDLPPAAGQTLPPGRWYDGAWSRWRDVPWRVHNFYVPVNNQRVMRPRRRGGGSSSVGSAHGGLARALEDQLQFEGRLKVWGMTGRLLVDAARIAYGEEPEMEHNETYGDVDVIMRAAREGVFDDDVVGRRDRGGGGGGGDGRGGDGRGGDGHGGPAKM